MRRMVLLAAAILLVAAMVLGVSAQTCATQVTCQATVSSDESCWLNISATFHLDAPVEELYFPVPVKATHITLNGSRVGSSVTEDARLVNLSRITGGMSGDFTVAISYRLRDVIGSDDNGFLQLQLPLLSGFSYPVEKLGFTVTMPGTLEGKPAFSSGYHQANIEQDLIFSYSENTVTGTSSKALKDHETLTMTLLVTEEMFPQAAIQLQELDGFYVAMAACGVLALLYWLLCLRAKPPRHITVSAPPEGYSAGQLGSLICLRSTDMTWLIFTWAQLGYLTIQLGRQDTVLLHKGMEMGNERSQYEQKLFRALFGNKTTVDTSGMRYVTLCNDVKKQPPKIPGLVHPRSGSRLIFRLLASLLGLLCGICMGLTLGKESAIPWIGGVLAGLGCFAASWLIHSWADCLFTDRKGWLVLSAVLCSGWVVISICARTFWLDGWVIALQLIFGLMGAYGGRRTDAGRQLMAEALGLRRFLRTLPRVQLQGIRQLNPEYYFSLAPYALALGCGKAFAKRFGRDRMPHCPYLTGISLRPMTALQWHKLLRQVAWQMEARQRQAPVERLVRFFQRRGT